jgi:hypothetical protein
MDIDYNTNVSGVADPVSRFRPIGVRLIEHVYHLRPEIRHHNVQQSQDLKLPLTGVSRLWALADYLV